MANLVPDYNHWHICPKCKHQTPLFVKEWVGLTDEDINSIEVNAIPLLEKRIAFAREVEAKSKEKNGY